MKTMANKRIRKGIPQNMLNEKEQIVKLKHEKPLKIEWYKLFSVAGYRGDCGSSNIFNRRIKHATKRNRQPRHSRVSSAGSDKASTSKTETRRVLVANDIRAAYPYFWQYQ